MRQMIYRLTEPAKTIPEERKLFTDHDLKVLILPLFLEQLLEVLVGVADTFMVSYAGEAAVSGVSLVNMFNTVFIFLFFSAGFRRRCSGEPVHREPGPGQWKSFGGTACDDICCIFCSGYDFISDI